MSLIHIYGFAVNDSETPPVKKPAKLYQLPFYGSAETDDDEKMSYIGIEIGKHHNPFDNLCCVQHGTFQMTNIEPSEDIIKKMKKLYPKKDLKCHSFLLDVYTSHYYSGSIMVGYFFSHAQIYTLENDDPDEEFDDPRDLQLSDIVIGDTKKIEKEVTVVAHTLKNGFGRYFL